MFRRRVEGIETMPLRFNVGTVGEREPHPPKNPDRAVEHLGERMQTADLVWRSRQRDINLGERARFFLRSKLLRAQVDRRGIGVPNFVEQLADRPASLPLRSVFICLAPSRNRRCARDILLARLRVLARQKQRLFLPVQLFEDLEVGAT